MPRAEVRVEAGLRMDDAKDVFNARGLHSFPLDQDPSVLLIKYLLLSLLVSLLVKLVLMMDISGASITLSSHHFPSARCSGLRIGSIEIDSSIHQLSTRLIAMLPSFPSPEAAGSSSSLAQSNGYQFKPAFNLLPPSIQCNP